MLTNNRAVIAILVLLGAAWVLACDATSLLVPQPVTVVVTATPPPPTQTPYVIVVTATPSSSTTSPLQVAATVTAQPRPSSAPTAASQWPVVFSDNFASNANAWGIATQQPSVTDYGTLDERIGGGKFRIDAKLTKGVSQKYWPKLPDVSDVSVSVDALRVSGSTNAAYGLMFRRDANGNFYLFQANDNKSFSVWIFQGQWIRLIDWTPTNALVPGQVNRLSATAIGSHMTFSINNQTVGSIDNNQLSRGTAGVVFEVDDPGEAVFEFSNFELRGPATAQVPTVLPTSAVTLLPAQWPMVISENFVSNANGWNLSSTQPNTSDHGSIDERIANGKLQLTAKIVKGINSSYWPKMRSVSDLSLTVDAKQVSGPTSVAYGVTFRRNGNTIFYAFEVREDKQFSVWLYQGQFTHLIDWTPTDAIHPGQVNRLNVTGVGSRLSFSINNQSVGSVDNNESSSGVGGVMFEMDANTQAVFEFSNFEVRAP